jgi:hypothetical protein
VFVEGLLQLGLQLAGARLSGGRPLSLALQRLFGTCRQGAEIVVGYCC